MFLSSQQSEFIFKKTAGQLQKAVKVARELDAAANVSNNDLLAELELAETREENPVTVSEFCHQELTQEQVR